MGGPTWQCGSRRRRRGPGLGARAEEEGLEAIVRCEETPGATHNAGARDVGRAQQA